MKDFEEKLLKRWLKRKVKITLATIVVFLISSSLSLAETLYIRDGENGVEFSIDNQNWGENPYPENSFENWIYTNNRKIESDRVGVVNRATNISIINSNLIVVNSQESAWGIDNNQAIGKIINKGLLEVNGTFFATGIGNYGGIIEELLNQGMIRATTTSAGLETAYGINNQGIIENLQNNGLIIGKGYYVGIENFGGIVSKLENKGIIMSEESDYAIGINNGCYSFIMENGGIIDSLTNKGIIDVKGNLSAYGIQNSSDGVINNLLNQGIIKIISSDSAIGIANLSNEMIENISNEGIIEVVGINSAIGIKFPAKKETKNKGVIKVTSSRSDARGIDITATNKEAESILNEGIIEVVGGSSNVNAIYTSEEIDSLVNKGILKTKGSNSLIATIGVNDNNDKIKKLEQNGIVFSDSLTIKFKSSNTDNIINNGLLIGNSSKFIENNYINNGMIFSLNNGKYKIENIGSSSNVINAALTDEENKNTNNWTATGSESIALDENKSDIIYNGITNTLKVDGARTLANSIVNGYTSAIVFDENGGSLTLDNSIINGGVDEASATIKGSSIVDNLALTNGTIINGNIDLGAGDDKLSINNTVQLNSDLFGGDGSDSLTFNGKDENNINIFNKVGGFENINVATDVTLFESAEVTGADSITIQKDGNLILRIDSTNGNSHALSGNTGTISSNGGKLLLALNGVGEGETISFGDTTLDESMKGNENGFKEATVDTTSLFHNVEKIDDKTVRVTTEEDIPYVSDVNYNELNTIYQSIRSIDGVKEFNVTDDKALVEFTNYLHDIYAGNPYSFSSELSRKSVNMFSDVVMGRDLHPEVNKWAIYGGLTHIDGGTKDTYFGKGYYTYDIGSKDIDVDSKITGMYVQGEYGVNETLNLGIIFGGNQSESEINNSSKVEGDSFYLGAYAKKYLGNLRLLAGIGYQYGDYEVDRVAVGYDGITTTRTFDSNYNDNTFNIYAQAKYSNKLAENLYLEPSVALDYTYVNQEGASENGVLAIETDSKDFNYTTAKFGVDLRKDIPTTTATHSLIAGAYYNRMLDGYEEENITGRFVGGSDFDILVSPSNKHKVGLRAKYEVSLNNGVTFDVKGSYTFERESYSGENKNEHKGEWIIGAGIGYRF